jgi:hypothetical protein
LISAPTVRIDDNLGRGTDGSNPVPSSGEFAGMFEPPAYARSRPNLHRQVAAAASRAAVIS